MSSEQKSRILALLDLANRTLASKQTDSGTIPRHRVSAELFSELRSGGLACILKLVGDKHPFYVEFNEQVRYAAPRDVEKAMGILKAIKSDLEN